MKKIQDLCVIIDGTGGGSGLEGGLLNTFECEVEAHLRKCAQTAVGKAVFAKIRAHGRVLIIPYTLSIDKHFNGSNRSPINALSVRGFDNFRFSGGDGGRLAAVRSNLDQRCLLFSTSVR